MGRRKGSKNKPKKDEQKPIFIKETILDSSHSSLIKRGRGRPRKIAIVPQVEKLEFKSIKRSPATLLVSNTNYHDDNGCSYFKICKGVNTKEENKTCFNPLYFIDKLQRKCKELKTNMEE